MFWWKFNAGKIKPGNYINSLIIDVVVACLKISENQLTFLGKTVRYITLKDLSTCRVEHPSFSIFK